VVQDTGWSQLFPGGEGVLPFSDLEGAVSAIERVEGDYECHRRAAREFAERHLASERVLGELLHRIGL